MFQYIKRNILRRGASPNNDFGFLADQLLYQCTSVALYTRHEADSVNFYGDTNGEMLISASVRSQ